MCKHRLGICWDEFNKTKQRIKYCSRKPVKDGYCVQHYKMHIINKQPNTEYILI